jgi:hypothetical protein
MKYDRHKIYYVYALLDPRKPGPFQYGHWKFSHEPFYIGKGKGSRHTVHCSKAHLENSTNLKAKRIKEIYRKGFEPITIIKRSDITEKQAFTLEAFFIEKIGRIDREEGVLLNANAGWTGVSPSERVRKNISRNSKRMHRNFNEEQKSSRGAKIGSGQAAYWERLRQDPKAYAARCKKVFTFDTLSATELDKIKKRMSKGRKIYMSNLTHEDKARISKSLSDAGKKAWQKRKVQGTNSWYSQ